MGEAAAEVVYVPDSGLWVLVFRGLPDRVPERSRVNHLLKAARDLRLRCTAVRFPNADELLASWEDEQEQREVGEMARRRPTDPTEAQFLRTVLELAGLRRWMCYHTHDSRHSAEGFPDLALVRGPVLLLPELKVEPNTPTAAQRAWLDALGRVQTVAAPLWYPADWKVIEATLE